MLSYLVLPYATLETAVRVMSLPLENNCIKRPPPTVRNRISRFSKDIPFKDFKKGCKANKCSLNEAIMSLIGVTLKEYANNRGNLSLKHIMISASFALKNFPESVEGITMGNAWVP